MFRDRIFNISFLISLFWHIFWIGIVTIITVPTGLSLAKYTKVYFLGPILEKTAFEMMLDESDLRVDTLYRRPIMPEYTLDVEIEGPEEGIFKPISESRGHFIFGFSPSDIVREDKAAPPYFFREGSSSFEMVSVSESPIKKRTVMFKPDKIPQVPRRIAKDKENFKIQLKFTVSPQGDVEKVKPVVSSGYPQVDMLGMDYLKKWRFSPLGPADEQKDHEGTIEIRLKAD